MTKKAKDNLKESTIGLFNGDNDNVMDSITEAINYNLIYGSDIDAIDIGEIDKDNIYYLLPLEELDEVVIEALNYAERNIQRIMNKSQFGLFQGNYIIYEYSYGYLYKQSYENKLFQAEMWNSGSEGLQWGASIYSGVKSTPSSGYKSIDASTIAIKSYIDKKDIVPSSIGNIVTSEIATINPYDDEALEKAQKKMEIINSSPYKYVIHASGPRKKFIQEIDEQIKKINSQDLDNERYKQTIINKLESIKNLNINYEQSEKDINYLLNSVDDMYR